jgi:hypothetical protein
MQEKRNIVVAVMMVLGWMCAAIGVSSNVAGVSPYVGAAITGDALIGMVIIIVVLVATGTCVGYLAFGVGFARGCDKFNKAFQQTESLRTQLGAVHDVMFVALDSAVQPSEDRPDHAR